MNPRVCKSVRVLRTNVLSPDIVTCSRVARHRPPRVMRFGAITQRDGHYARAVNIRRPRGPAYRLLSDHNSDQHHHHHHHHQPQHRDHPHHHHQHYLSKGVKCFYLVCSFVSRIARKQLERFSQKPVERCYTGHGRTH